MSETRVDWAAVGYGTVAGAAVLVCVSIAIVVTQHNVSDFSTGVWPKVFAVLLLLGYLLAGWVAGWIAPRVPLRNGALAGAGAMVLWIPLRVLIWLVRDGGKPLVAGSDPALPVGPVVVGVGIGALLGLIGAYVASIGARRAAQAGGSDPARDPESDHRP